VGLASRNGLDFLPIYIGPLIVILLGLPLIARVIHIARVHRITSVADFIGSRYGKSVKVAALVALIAIIGTVPYIALQLKAISAALETIVLRELGYVPQISGLSALGDISLFVSRAKNSPYGPETVTVSPIADIFARVTTLLAARPAPTLNPYTQSIALATDAIWCVVPSSASVLA
jgi:hypothetical protein